VRRFLSSALLPIHQAQLLSYLKLGGWKLGLLINFHASLLREGIKRVVLGLEEPPPPSPEVNRKS
jgi:hypothetical protein